VPELPEVETVVRDLRPLLVGRVITRVEIGAKALRKSWSPEWENEILQRGVRAIERRGKWILVDLAGPWLLVHLGMTGQFTVAPADLPRGDHTHAVFHLDLGAAELRFRDIRRFGSITLFPDRASLDAHFIASELGPEPWELDLKAWRASLAGTGRILKAVLLDQTIVAGVGNIYADESLFEAKLHPELRARDLTKIQAERLHRAILTVLEKAITLRGSSIRNYVGGSGLQGGFQAEFCVYGRTGEPCPRCQTPIEMLRLAGRSSHFCPRCQRKRT
jgi:formamidopyrimidine-DNA glycosylase